jgi:hypothetical protein
MASLTRELLLRFNVLTIRETISFGRDYITAIPRAKICQDLNRKKLRENLEVVLSHHKPTTESQTIIQREQTTKKKNLPLRNHHTLAYMKSIRNINSHVDRRSSR